MKRLSFLFVLSLFLFSGVYSGKAFSSQSINRPVIKAWDFVRFADDVFTYSFSKKDKVMGTFHFRHLKRKMNWRKLGSKKLFDKIIANKKAMMSLISISNWKLSKKSFKKKKGYYELEMDGSYFDKDDKLIFFKELHLYYPRKVHQILVTSPDRSFLRGKNNEAFINGVKSFLKSERDSEAI